MDAAVVHVEVETQPDGTLDVRWIVEGPPVAVAVSTGATPEHVDHVHHVTVPAGTTTAVVPGSPGGRTFVSVAPAGGGPAVVAADRRVPFEGITNFRDLGGYPTGDGRRVRWGRVFRADALHGLTADDLDLYETLGMQAVYDLRTEGERDERPNPVPSRPITLLSPRRDGREPLSADEGEHVLQRLYLDLVRDAAPTIGRILSELARPEHLPAVFHCHAGKDRTGIVAATLLLVLGVDREAILDDYELTGRYRMRSQQESTFQRLLDAGLAPEVAASVLTTPRPAMAAAIDLVDASGGVEAWLTGPAGVTAGEVATLRELLLTPS